MSRWNEKKEKFEILIETFNELYTKYIPPLIDLIFEGINEDEIGKPFEQSLNRTNLNLVMQLTKLLEGLI